MGLPRKLLIANRGEIACRIARTARRLGVRTVAVYSDADADALHVAACDEALRIGPSPAAQSYLCGDAILEAAARSGAQALHPGYGFLSENAAFAEACAAAGVTFVGPPASAIRAMGLKSAAKALMQRAGVPLVPGYHGEDQDPGVLAHEASRIGYPVLIKASAGGGGKGMRRVDSAAEFAAALASCRREAATAFGDDAVLIERYVERPRHVEIQVFADQQGHCISLFERDCSVQRRHQKVLEEAPAPGITPELRAAMGCAAVEAARAVGYVGAGTVEFILDPDGRFYFMEMNTRLQVEHPVTEMITGLDLVEWQLRVAGGEALPLAQGELTLRGHAIEARLYAEDPDRGFLPSIGRLVHAVLPESSEHVRVDSGVAPGDLVSPYYDAMLAKLIVWGPDREQARRQLQDALGECQIVGVATNAAFLFRLVDSASFRVADLDTSLIERERDALFPPITAPPRHAWLICAAAALAQPTRPVSPWASWDGWRIGARAVRALTLRAGDLVRELTVRYSAQGWELTLDDVRTEAAARYLSATGLSVDLGSQRYHVASVVHDGVRHVFFGSEHYAFRMADPFAAPGVVDVGAGHLRAPMPGKIIAVLSRPGAEVSKGAPLVVLEAMKMEHTICAPFAGRITSYRVAEGDQVPEGEELVELLAEGVQREAN